MYEVIDDKHTSLAIFFDREKAEDYCDYLATIWTDASVYPLSFEDAADMLKTLGHAANACGC